jgi:hypothetical protein
MQSALGDLALAVPIGFFVLSYAVSAAAPGRERLAGGLLLVALGIVAVARHAARGSSMVAAAAPRGGSGGIQNGGNAVPPPRRRLPIEGSLASTVVLAVFLTSILAATGLVSGRPATLNRPAPVSSSVIDDPVGATASLRDGDPEKRPFPVVRIDSDRPSSGYLAAALLDNFDGSEWTFSATFEPTGERVPARAGSIAVVGGVSLRTTETLLSDLPFSLLPTPDRPVAVRGAAVAVDGATAMILPRDAHPGTTFTVTSVVPTATLSGVPPADGIGSPGGGANGVVSPDLAMPPDSTPALAVAMRFVAGLTGSRPEPTVAFMQRLLLALRSHERQLSPYAPAEAGQGAASGETPSGDAAPPTSAPAEGGGHLRGTSLSEVINAVTVDRSATPEQFATFVALVARYLGVPARIATGFRVAPGSTGSLVPAGVHRVDNRQAWTWVEIPVAGMGWVVADPTPDVLTGISAPPPEQAQATPTTLPNNKANAVPRNATSGGHAIAKPARLNARRSSGLPGWLAGLLLAGGLVVAVLLAGPALSATRRYLRTRARRSDDPIVLATGAWLELLDGLDRAGMQVADSATGMEVAGEAAAHFGAEVRSQVVDVAVIVDRGLYSTLDPPTAEDALRAWSAQRQLTRHVLQGLDRRQRARALMTVGSSPRRPAP